jgi:DNA-binding transcriptional ArsR family regulator
MTIDIGKEGLRLAALIGDQPPHIETEADLIEYADYVQMIVRSRARFDEEAIDDLRAKLDPDGWWRAFHKGNARMQGRMNRLNALKTVHAINVAKRQTQGAETRAKIARLAALYSRLPERSQAAAIAKRLLMSPRQVRRHLEALRGGWGRK